MVDWKVVTWGVGITFPMAGFTILGSLIAKAAGGDQFLGVMAGSVISLGITFLFLQISQEIHDICGRKN